MSKARGSTMGSENVLENTRNIK